MKQTNTQATGTISAKQTHPHLTGLAKTNPLVNAILHVCVNNVDKNRDAVVKAVAEKCAKHNIVKTKKGTLITSKNIRSLMLAMARDIKNCRKGWWNFYVVEEDAQTKVIRFVVKPL